VAYGYPLRFEDGAALLSSVDLSYADIKKLDEISARRYGEIYRLVMRETQDEWFGMFTGGGRVPLGSFRMMGLALLQCSNLRKAIYRAGDFATWHRFTEWLIDTEVPLTCISLKYAESEINAPLAYPGLRKITFGAEHNGLSYSSKFLDYPIVQTEESLSAISLSDRRPVAHGPRGQSTQYS